MKAIVFFDGLLGRYALEENEGQLTRMWVGDRITLAPADVDIRETPMLKEAKAQLDAYFAGRLKAFELPLAPAGTEFQMKVWKDRKSVV